MIPDVHGSSRRATAARGHRHIAAQAEFAATSDQPAECEPRLTHPSRPVGLDLRVAVSYGRDRLTSLIRTVCAQCEPYVWLRAWPPITPLSP